MRRWSRLSTAAPPRWSCRRPSPTRMAGRPPSARASTSRTWGETSPMSDAVGFFFLLMSNGVMIGLMYSLIALGFVLVYKATDAVNFAQGEFVMIAALAVALSMLAGGAPLWLATLMGLPGMTASGFRWGRGVSRKLIGRPVMAGAM